jgi:hypothetical protein
VDNMTTSPQDTYDSSRQRLTQQLNSLWSATRPWTAPPADWLDAAATALATPVPLGTGESDHVGASDLVRWQEAAEQLRLLRDQTRHHASAATTRRTQLTRLQAQVRQRAIDQLDDNPELEDSLRDALAEWGLPPIDRDDEEDSDT